MNLLRALRIAASPVEFVRRRRTGRHWTHASQLPLRIDPDIGWRTVSPDELFGLYDVLESAREIRRAREASMRAMLIERRGKHRIVFDLLSDAELARRPDLVAFAMQDPLVRVATEYLGTVPVLRRVGLGLSPGSPRPDGPYHSQLFHLDGEDFRQLKLLVNVSDVTDEDGPFTFLDASATRRVLQGSELDLHARVSRQSGGGRTTTPRFSDAEVVRHVAPRDWKRLIGPAGSALLVDTSRCLHFGSRVAPGRERLVLGVVFQRYHTVNESPFNCIRPGAVPRHPLERMLLAQPRPVAPGTYYPEFETAGARSADMGAPEA